MIQFSRAGFRSLALGAEVMKVLLQCIPTTKLQNGEAERLQTLTIYERDPICSKMVVGAGNFRCWLLFSANDSHPISQQKVRSCKGFTLHLFWSLSWLRQDILIFQFITSSHMENKTIKEKSP